ncbi:hypothetical protein QFC21_004804 [Naganishia friedmannii]|uniref:Uncharacterized protein n=3 Tax=Naganishia friedmannii TaxID=89922 RepID=A0ACC2VED8_9TREE|nr:hypothetical protein QFC21_004802 [Naganishia friedmannii]KAJ9097765.1 hypothetical protein QFC21_004803 [Naganishia friedmannii]KAJ9097766.1 hypothetical protein QFC21_004804 [Naganishia friedmannii]
MSCGKPAFRGSAMWAPVTSGQMASKEDALRDLVKKLQTSGLGRYTSALELLNKAEWKLVAAFAKAQHLAVGKHKPSWATLRKIFQQTNDTTGWPTDSPGPNVENTLLKDLHQVTSAAAVSYAHKLTPNAITFTGNKDEIRIYGEIRLEMLWIAKNR